MKRLITTAAAAALTLTLAACGGGQPSHQASYRACKTALAREYAAVARAVLAGQTPATPRAPAACKALPAADQRKIARQVLRNAGLPPPSASPASFADRVRAAHPDLAAASDADLNRLRGDICAAGPGHAIRSAMRAGFPRAEAASIVTAARCP